MYTVLLTAASLSCPSKMDNNNDNGGGDMGGGDFDGGDMGGGDF